MLRWQLCLLQIFATPSQILRPIACVYIQGKVQSQIVSDEDLVALGLLDSLELVENLVEELEPEVLLEKQFAL